MTREKMIDRLVKKFGHEDNRVIWFCGLCEEYEENEWNNRGLEGLCISLLTGQC